MNSIKLVPLSCSLCLPSTMMFNSTTFHIFSFGEFRFIYFSLSFHIFFSHITLLASSIPFQFFYFCSFSAIPISFILPMPISYHITLYQFTTSPGKQQPQQESKYKNPYHYYVLQRKKALRWKVEAHVQSII